MNTRNDIFLLFRWGRAALGEVTHSACISERGLRSLNDNVGRRNITDGCAHNNFVAEMFVSQLARRWRLAIT